MSNVRLLVTYLDELEKIAEEKEKKKKGFISDDMKERLGTAALYGAGSIYSQAKNKYRSDTSRKWYRPWRKKEPAKGLVDAAKHVYKNMGHAALSKKTDDSVKGGYQDAAQLQAIRHGYKNRNDD